MGDTNDSIVVAFKTPVERRNDFIAKSLCIPCYLMLQKVRQATRRCEKENTRNIIELSSLGARCIVISNQMEESRRGV